MGNFGVSWPDELRCASFPEEMCISVSNGHLVDEEFGLVMLKIQNHFSRLPFPFVSQEDSRSEVIQVRVFKHLMLNLR